MRITRPSFALACAALLAPVLCATLTGCGSPPAPLAGAAAVDPVLLRAWDVPEGYAPRLVGSINRLIEREGGPGRAAEGPGGTLLVVAPVGVIDGVDGLVKRAVEAPPAPAQRNVEVTYWLVRGVPADADSRGPGLDPLDATLDAIVATDGPQALSLVARRSLRTLDGERGAIKDHQAELSQVVSIEPGTDHVVADVRVTVPRATEVDTRLSLRTGAHAVLSQAGYDDDAGASSLYVIVRPEIVAAP